MRAVGIAAAVGVSLALLWLAGGWFALVIAAALTIAADLAYEAHSEAGAVDLDDLFDDWAGVWPNDVGSIE